MPMNRRGFLKRAGAAAGAAAASSLPVKLHPAQARARGFGLAAVKTEGAAVEYDVTSGLAKAMYPGVKKWWTKGETGW